MQAFDLIDVARQALITTLVVTSPILLVSLIAGIATGFFQAVTQIHDQALSFIPKLFAVLVCMAVLGVWVMEYLVDYAANVFSNPHLF
jgi:flagellar biosynthetic protein FliQ